MTKKYIPTLAQEMDAREITYPKRFLPLPTGYKVVQLDSGHFMWIGPKDEEGPISWDKYWVRRCAFAHFEGKFIFV